MKEKPQIDESLEHILREKMEQMAQDKQISCSAAFKISASLGISPALVGQYTDVMKIKIIRCSLGLFGYQPEKRLVKPDYDYSPELKQAIEAALVEGRLSCSAAWSIADQQGIPRSKTANVCESLNIKINQCQLGAF